MFRVPLHIVVSTLGQSPVPLFPDQASRQAQSVDLLYFALLIFSGLVVLTVLILVLYFGIRYRASADVDRRGRILRTLPFEMTWIVMFTVVGLALFTWAAGVYFNLQRPPKDAATIYVVGKQWMWKLRHPSGPEEINTLHVPVGEPIKLVMTSQDVIHSFYVPAFRVKQDVLPQQYTTMWFTPSKPGTYHLYCAEYCGAEHSEMTGQVIVMRPNEYEQWLSSQGGQAVGATPGTPQAPMYVEGANVFNQFNCGACHTRDSQKRAPRLDGIFGRPVRLQNGETVIADAQYIRESIFRPNAKISAGYDQPSLMPTYRGQINEKQLQALVRFIQSLRDGWPPRDNQATTPGSKTRPATQADARATDKQETVDDQETP